MSNWRSWPRIAKVLSKGFLSVHHGKALPIDIIEKVQILFNKAIAQELKRERFEGYKQGVKDEIECVETSGEHADLRAKLKKVKGSQSH